MKAPAKAASKAVAALPAKAKGKVAAGAPKPPVALYEMPREVSDWVAHAGSRIAHLTSKVARLEEEILNLKVANKAMTKRIMGMEPE
jgi:hypothetical protein